MLGLVKKHIVEQLKVKTPLVSVLLFVVVAALSRHTSANSDTIRVVANHLPPYMTISNDPAQSRYSGFEYELTMLLEKETGYKFEFVECTWSGCIDALKKGHVDLVHSMLYSDLRDQFVSFLKPAYLQGEYATLFYQRFNDPRVIASFEDMVKQEMVIGYLGSTVYFPELEQTDDLIKVDVKNIEIGVKLLANGRIDALAGFEELLYDLEERVPKLLKVLKHGEYQPKAMMESQSAFSRNSPRFHLRATLEQALQKLEQDGSYEALRAKWIKAIEVPGQN